MSYVPANLFSGNGSTGFCIPDPFVNGSQSLFVFLVDERNWSLQFEFLGFCHAQMLAPIKAERNRIAGGSVKF